LRKVGANFASVLDALRDYVEHEPPVRPRDRLYVDLWQWNLADNGYGEFPEEAVEEALHEYGDEIFEGVE
jgi:hypothetical protein